MDNIRFPYVFDLERDGFIVAKRLIHPYKISQYQAWYRKNEDFASDVYKTSPYMLDILCGEEIRRLFTYLGSTASLHSTISRQTNEGCQWHCDLLPEGQQESHLAVWVALGHVGRDEGMFQIIAGSNNWDFDRTKAVLTPGDSHTLPEVVDFELMDRGDPHPYWFAADLGDVLVWHGGAIHGAQAPRGGGSVHRPSLIGHYANHTNVAQHTHQGEIGWTYVP